MCIKVSDAFSEKQKNLGIMQLSISPFIFYLFSFIPRKANNSCNRFHFSSNSCSARFRTNTIIVGRNLLKSVWETQNKKINALSNVRYLYHKGFINFRTLIQLTIEFSTGCKIENEKRSRWFSCYQSVLIIQQWFHKGFQVIDVSETGGEKSSSKILDMHIKHMIHFSPN